MCNNVFSACLSMLFLLLLTLSGRAEDSSTKSDPPHEVHTLQIQGMELRGEEIDYKIQQDGRHQISLRGQAEMRIGVLAVEADFIQAGYTSTKDLVLDLKGQVSIVSPLSQLRARSAEAMFDLGAKSLSLKGSEKEPAQLTRYISSKVTQLDAPEIQIKLSQTDAMLIKSQGPVEISERKRTPADDFPVLQAVSHDLLPSTPFPSLELPAAQFTPVRSNSLTAPIQEYPRNNQLKN
ncbi:hypothetical protein [Gimesia algae]|uniref:Auto-transporter adhesin head GIN domain-containing protein n=1 Tax=Gimesia algae TaxID=2527971 RepID=A0A517VDE8_9PLAN|nr:hypothetical protein [Gimesia algae]QDT91034.1 hypothetical protein Pan161_26880 [Gimesia algae]